jgi:hypothetical protein
VDPARCAVWAWDARPFPAFPAASDVWADGSAHETGHWLTGRLGQAPLAELAADILARSGAPSFDTSALEGVLDGYVIDRPASAREELEPLQDLFAFGAVERDGAIVLMPRGRGDVRCLGDNDLAAGRDGAEPDFVRAQESELPGEIVVGFEDLAADFRPSVATAQRRGTEARGIVTRDLAVISGLSEMRRRAVIQLQDLWIGRETARFAVPPSDIALEPGDLVRFERAAPARLFEIVEISDGPTRQISARAIQPEIFEAPRFAESRRTQRQPPLAGPPELVLLDLPVASGESPILTHVAVAAKPWPGAVTVWRDAGGTFQPILRAATPAIIGETQTDLPAGPVWRFDDAASVVVWVSGGELMAATDERLYAGANLAAVQTLSGSWEVMQFGRAELVAENTYRLGHLLRGQSGTEAEAGMLKPEGSRFVLLDDGVLPLISGIDALERAVEIRAAPAGRDFADDTAVAAIATPGPAALRPFAPVHLKAEREEGGLVFRWTRRTRQGGDAWEATEVPLGEEREHYLVEIMSGDQVVRSVQTSQPQLFYEEAERVADFGASMSAITVRVFQISAVVGAGRAAERTFHV